MRKLKAKKVVKKKSSIDVNLLSKSPLMNGVNLNLGTDYSKDGKCPTGCNQCCTVRLPLSDEEFEAMKKIVYESNAEDLFKIYRTMRDRGQYYLMCPFNDIENKGKCVIYDKRPFACRIYHCNKEKALEAIFKSIISGEATKDGSVIRTKSLIDVFPEDIQEYLREGFRELEKVKAGESNALLQNPF